MVSDGVAPRESAASFRSPGTRVITSLPMEAEYGRIMKARRTEEVRIETPKGGTPTAIWITRMTGTRKKSPMKPYTTEGIPARSSTAVRIMEENAPVRKYSPIRMASARDRTVAMTRAIKELRRVPKTKGTAWNVFVTGSHAVPVRNLKPLATRAGREETSRERKMAMSSTLTAIPPRVRVVRNALSDSFSLFMPSAAPCRSSYIKSFPISSEGCR